MYGSNDVKGGCVEIKTAEVVRTCNIVLDSFTGRCQLLVALPSQPRMTHASVNSCDRFDISYSYVGITQSVGDHLLVIIPFNVAYLRLPVMVESGSCHRDQTESTE